jgi:hypothetical protein
MKNDSTYSTWVKAAGSWGYSRPAAKRRAHPVRGHRRGDAPIPHTRGRRAGVGPPARAPRLPCGSPLGHLEKQKALLDVEFPISFPCQVVTKEAHGLGPVHSLPALSPLLSSGATRRDGGGICFLLRLRRRHWYAPASIPLSYASLLC